MALMKWNRSSVMDPFRHLLDLQDDMNRLFDISLAKMPKEVIPTEWVPAVNVTEERDRFVVKADLPGIEQDKIDIEIQDNVLTIKGERSEEKEEKDKNFLRRECFYGAFERSLALPTDVDAGKAEAEYKDGVLIVTLPKKEEKKAKQIKLSLKKK